MWNVLKVGRNTNLFSYIRYMKEQESSRVEAPMRIGKWLYVTAAEEGQTKDVVVNIDAITLMEPNDEDNHCEIGILRGDGTCAELNLIHDFYEIVGLL